MWITILNSQQAQAPDEWLNTADRPIVRATNLSHHPGLRKCRCKFNFRR